jgi:hypothetical protein
LAVPVAVVVVLMPTIASVPGTCAQAPVVAAVTIAATSAARVANFIIL